MNNKLKSIIFYLTLFLFITLVSFQANSVDFDLFARLLQGKAFWQLGNILHHDIFSYTPTHTWYDHEWGSSVVFYWVFERFGEMGFLWMKAFMLFAIFCFVIETIKLRGVKYSTPYNFLVYFFAYHSASQAGFSNTIRCTLFTYLFFAIWLYLLERTRLKKEYFWLVTFIPMMLFWLNIHGGCAAGLGLVVLYAIGEALNKKPFKYYIFTIIGCSLITLVNPYGWDYVKFLIMATTMPRILIAEWQPTFCEFNAGSFLGFKTYLLAVLSVILARLVMKFKSLKNIDYTKALILFVMTYLSLKYTRHQPFFVFCTLVFLYDDFYRLISVVTSKLIKSEKIRQHLENIKVIFLFLFVAIATIGWFSLNKPQMVIQHYEYPVKVIEFLKLNNIKGNILVDFQEGSYTAYKLYPNNLIAMDGRYEEVYPDYMLLLFNNFFMQAGENPNLLLEKFRPDIIVVRKRFDKAKEYLNQDKSYKKVYADKHYTLYLDKALLKKDYKQPTDSNDYYNKTMFDSNLKFKKLKSKKTSKS